MGQRRASRQSTAGDFELVERTCNVSGVIGFLLWLLMVVLWGVGMVPIQREDWIRGRQEFIFSG